MSAPDPLRTLGWQVKLSLMSSRVTNLLLGASLAAFSTASFGAAVGNTALFAYAAIGGFLLGVASQLLDAVWKGQRR